MNKKTITLSLTALFLLGSTACVKDNECPVPVVPQSKIQVENSYRILKAYPADELPADGVLDLSDITEIAQEVFTNAKIKSVTAKKLQKIGANAFKGSTIMTLVLDKTVPETAADAFASTSTEKNLQVDAEVATKFYAYAAKHGFKSINGVALPQIVIKDGTLSSYPDYLLEESIKLDAQVTALGDKVFEGKSIKELHGSMLKKIGAAALKGATSLMKVELGETIPEAADDAFAETPQDKDLVVPESAVAAYKEFATKHGFKTINGKEVYPVPSTVTIEGTELMKVSGDYTQATLELPPYVKTIHLGALKNNQYIKHVTGIGVTEIGESAFNGMRKLIDVNFPNVKKIGRNAFNGAQALKKCVAPKLEEVGAGAFNKCTALEEVNYPLLKVIPQDAFRAGWDGKLATIILPSATTIEANAFGYHPNVKTIELGSVPPTVDPQAFDNALKTKSPKLLVPSSAVSAYGTAGAKWHNIFVITAK